MRGAQCSWDWVQNGVTITMGFESSDGLVPLSTPSPTWDHPNSSPSHARRWCSLANLTVCTHQPAERLTETFSVLGRLQNCDGSILRLGDLMKSWSGQRTDPSWFLPKEILTELTSDPDRWHALKHQFSFGELANTGRGLQTDGGDSSPYSFGTSVGSGWVRNDDGSYSTSTTHHTR